MTKADEPAFPRTYSHDGHNGLTKREYFAGLAMQGLLPQVGRNSQLQDAYDIAVWSAQAADALIAELAKAEPEDVAAPGNGWISWSGDDESPVPSLTEVRIRTIRGYSFVATAGGVDWADVDFYRIVKGGEA